MDGSDRRLIGLLVHDPRATYRDLADAMGISVQAVHRRIQQLLDIKVVLGFTATISSAYLEAVPVTVCGRSMNRTREETIRALDDNDLVAGVLFGSGGMVYVQGVLRKGGELDRFYDHVRKAARLKDPWIGLETVEPLGKAPSTMEEEPLTPLDRRIITMLTRDCRMPAAEVAKGLGVTAATVVRRLERLERIGAIEYVLALHPGFSGDIVAMVRVEMAEGADRGGKIAAMRRTPSMTIEYYRQFSNLPNLFTCVSWTPTLQGLEAITDELLQDKEVCQVVPDIIFTGWYHPSWKDLMAMGVPGKG